MSTLAKALRSDRPRSDLPRRRRWPWIVSGIAVAVVAAVVAVVVVATQFGLPWWKGDGDRNHVYESDAGSLRYQVHVPPQYDGTTQLPVVMAIHGCGMTGYGLNSMKSTTQFNSLADREGFIVVYPTQGLFRNLINCWDSGDPREQHRYSGEPALLAGVAREVVEEYNADPDHVHVAGASSGAGAAVILAATYPDVFATATSVAGGEYGMNQVDPDDPDATPPDYTARQAWAQMGDRARQVPLLVIQGEQDEVVPPLVATRLVDDGLLNDSLGVAEETTTVPSSADRHAYTHTTITAPDGTSVVESYLVQNMGHAWPCPAADGLFHQVHDTRRGMMITARGLMKRYGGTVAVDAIDFSVEPGTVTGFLGPNGAGKSTTMRMAMGLDHPSSGSITINGRDYRDLPVPP